MMISNIAKQVPGVRSPTKNGVWRKAWGALIHTTGGGITSLAKKQKREPIDVALQIYIASQNGSNGYLWGGPAYVMEHDGDLYQIAPDDIRTNHCGGPNRQWYRDGSWIKKASPFTVARWNAQWGPKFDDPYDLFPSKNPNVDYVGLEMIPCGDGFGEPMRPGLRFTKMQHDSVISWCRDLAARHSWPRGWERTSRLVGHEDVDILERDDRNGGWDPGWLRAIPYFDFDYVRNRIS